MKVHIKNISDHDHLKEIRLKEHTGPFLFLKYFVFQRGNAKVKLKPVRLLRKNKVCQCNFTLTFG